MSPMSPSITSAPQFPAAVQPTAGRIARPRSAVTEAQIARAIARGRRLQGEAMRAIFGAALRRVLHPIAGQQSRREGAYGNRAQAC
ncbi:hypothetical protein [Pelagibius sp.]|uniref:hypothetical protein n=1 Tax=Pelagibius sp. TaxID=1931238 RepID=UPI00260A5879|nr:hypothetical protein [Pelagibius sp.]